MQCIFLVDKPKISILRYPEGYIEEGHQMKLECLEKSNPPETNITWVKDGVILSSDPIFEKTNMKTNDSGNYSCIVFNSLGGELEYIVVFVNKSNGEYNDCKFILYCTFKRNSIL